MTNTSNILTREEQDEIDSISQTFYMKPPIDLTNKFIATKGRSSPDTILESLNHIESFMRESQDSVNQIQEERKKRGEIKDISQSGKAIVGSMFAQLLHYLLLKNKEVGNIPAHILVTRSKAQAERMFEEDFKVYIGGEKQTPDCDMIIYNKNTKKFIILSLKTSLRERAGQTFKWKLLWEIANSSNTKLKDKFDIKYKGKVTPNICFVTADFYHEIDSSQHRGMFKFFDGSFIAKPNVEHDLVMSLSDLPAYIKKSLCR